MTLRLRSRGAPLVAALALTACDTITDLPKGWNTTWVVPGESVTIAVDSLLPGAVQVAPGGAAFVVDIAGATLSTRLGDMCAPCELIDDQTLPKPAFTYSTSSTIPLPIDVVSIEVAGGGFSLELGNGLSFDPINPPGASAPGSMSMQIGAGGATLTGTQIDGATTPFAPGDTLVRPLAFAQTMVASDLTVDFSIDSPAGSAVPIDADDSLRVVVQPGQVQVASITVNVPAQIISSSETLDIDVDSAVIERVHGGGLVLHVDNDFAVGGTFTVRITAPGAAPIQRSFIITTGTSTQTVLLTGAEMRSVLGKQATLDIAGTVSSPSGTVTVTPGQELVVSSDVVITVGPRIGEGN